MQGVYIDYYFHCKRQLWLYAKNIRMEHTSEDVEIGKFISENTYDRKIHEIYLSDCDNNEGVIDFMDKKRKIIHEVKKSKKMEDLHIWQIKYYIYLLENLGVNGIKGEIDYPKIKKIIKVEFSDKDKNDIQSIINEINRILKMQLPPPIINEPYCKRCSYYEFCYC